jgi:hypothetical protein
MATTPKQEVACRGVLGRQHRVDAGPDDPPLAAGGE